MNYREKNNEPLIDYITRIKKVFRKNLTIEEKRTARQLLEDGALRQEKIEGLIVYTLKPLPILSKEQVKYIKENQMDGAQDLSNKINRKLEQINFIKCDIIDKYEEVDELGMMEKLEALLESIDKCLKHKENV